MCPHSYLAPDICSIWSSVKLIVYLLDKYFRSLEILEDWNILHETFLIFIHN